jgi:putative ABC transport system permease protein
MDNLKQDFVYALRTLRKSPGLVAVAVMSLGLGIGANVAIFAAVDVFMLRPLPIDGEDRLLDVFSTVPERGWMNNVLSIPDFLDYREQSRTMNVAGRFGSDFNMSGTDVPERVDGSRVSWNFFEVVGTQPVLGRAFRPEEENDGQDQVVILSDGLWRRRFGADPDIVGQTLLLDAEPHTVIGVLPPRFWVDGDRIDLYAPFGLTGEEHRGSHFMTALGRLRPGATEEQARSEVVEIARRLEEAYPESNEGWSGGVRLFRKQIFGEEFEMGSIISSVAVAFVLLIACINVANLMLTKVSARDREIAVRCALGAGRGRIVRQLLTEAMIISFMGGIFGIFVSIAGIRGIKSLMPATFPFAQDVALDARSLSFAIGVTVLTGLLFGSVPALQSTRANLTDSLKEGGRGHAGAKGDRLRKLFAVGEIAMALALLVSAALLVQAFLGLQVGDFGWNEDNLLTFRLALPAKEYAEDATVGGFYRQLVPALEAVPGVQVVGGISQLPLQGNSNTYYSIPGDEYASLQEHPVVEFRFVAPGYFAAMDIPIVRGQGLEGADREDGPAVVVVSEALVERHWPGEDPIGKQIEYWDETREIVGVAGDILDRRGNPRVVSYMSAFQYPQRGMTMTLRTAGPPTSVVDAVRAEVLRLDPNLPMYRVMSMAEVRYQSTMGDAVMAKIMGTLAVITLLLAVVGVYGVMAYSVSQRTQEMGVRLALGARPADVQRMVLRQGALLAIIGIVIGLVFASLLTRSLSIFLYGVSPFDPVTFVLVTATLLLSAVGATYIPALRATRVDPLDALRSE